MTEIVYAIIDNHRKKKGTTYNIIFKTKILEGFEEYVKIKGLKDR